MKKGKLDLKIDEGQIQNKPKEEIKQKEKIEIEINYKD